MPEDLSNAISIEQPFPAEAEQATAEPPDDDAEPEGAVEIAPGRRMVDVSVVAAERKRARESAEKRVQKEMEPLKQQAQRVGELEAAVAAMRPYADFLQQNPHLLQQRQPEPEETISDQEAEQEARELQLYDSQSKLDINTAKRIIARRRSETQQAAYAAAEQAVAPIQAATAEERSRNNFAQMATMTDANGHPLVDPEILAREWVQLPAHLTQHPQVAEVVLERAIGKSLRSGRRGVPPSRSPVYSESPGGRVATQVQLTEHSRRLGLNEKDLKDSSKNFNPGGASTIGEW